MGNILEGRSLQIGQDQIAIVEHMELLGIPFALQQRIRDQSFLETANETLKAADGASILYQQYSLLIIRTCIASKLTRFIETTKFSPILLSQFDQLLKQKILTLVRADQDTLKEIISLLIKLS
ncbi:MAG: hypothetical protein EZS28_011131 [Streblomastix strix]|uniref:Uncharacterized protein n=1 Tax=Streblomastix strix TaxID=222440 RepID=A0A5J4WG40_9EUKA|nr:MAG: hypothetical protein EZS28_011131 [Streblomastix strix]